jgi:hypothetical protein
MLTFSGWESVFFRVGLFPPPGGTKKISDATTNYSTSFLGDFGGGQLLKCSHTVVCDDAHLMGGGFAVIRNGARLRGSK